MKCDRERQKARNEMSRSLALWAAVFGVVAFDSLLPTPAHSLNLAQHVEYGVGDLVVISSHRLHQIQPFEGDRDRISVTLHCVATDHGWESWF